MNRSVPVAWPIVIRRTGDVPRRIDEALFDDDTTALLFVPGCRGRGGAGDGGPTEQGLTWQSDTANRPFMKSINLPVTSTAVASRCRLKLRQCGVNILGCAVALSALAAPPSFAQETPRELVAAYESLADSILAVKRTEANLVRSLLAGHRDRAEAYFRSGQFEQAAAEIALFANEGDNRVAGVRKPLIDGGHHHNAEGEKQGIFEAGYVVVTKAAKAKGLAASAALRQAKTRDERSKAFGEFTAIAKSLLAQK